MRKRGPGVGGIKRSENLNNALKEKGAEIQEDKVKHMTEVMTQSCKQIMLDSASATRFYSAEYGFILCIDFLRPLVDVTSNFTSSTTTTTYRQQHELFILLRNVQVIDTFRTHLEEFARKYKTQIRSDPVFRAQFQIMCEKVGVDPLASSKGLWGELLGLGDYYYELGVRIVEVNLLYSSFTGLCTYSCLALKLAGVWRRCK